MTACLAQLEISDTDVSTAQQHPATVSALPAHTDMIDLGFFFPSLCETHTHTGGIKLQVLLISPHGDAAFPFPLLDVRLLSVLNTRPFPPFQKQLPLCFCATEDNRGDVF